MVTDTVSDFIIRIKNASNARKTTVAVGHSKFNESIAHAMKKAGYILDIETSKDKRELVIGLVYIGKEPRIHDIERISKPSRRLYQKSRDIRSYKSGYGNVFYSTPKGIMTDVEAKKSKVGGEILFRIW